MKNGSLMKVESIAECSPWSILQYFWPTLREIRYWSPFLVFFLSGLLRQVLLYENNHFSCKTLKMYIQYNSRKYTDIGQVKQIFLA